jgi:hypothetical protein
MSVSVQKLINSQVNSSIGGRSLGSHWGCASSRQRCETTYQFWEEVKVSASG